MSGFGGGGAPLLGTVTTLWRLTTANMNSTADQAFTPLFPFTKFVITQIVVTNASGAISLAAGGIYTGASKSGTIIVAAAQTWAGLSSTTKVIYPTLTTAGQELITRTGLFLSLTTGMGSPATADFFFMGIAQ